MHNLLFEKHDERSHKKQVNQEIFIPYAEQIGLNMEQFATDVISFDVQQRVKRDKAE